MKKIITASISAISLIVASAIIIPSLLTPAASVSSVQYKNQPFLFEAGTRSQATPPRQYREPPLPRVNLGQNAGGQTCSPKPQPNIQTMLNK
jgi:hypothetical protein